MGETVELRFEAGRCVAINGKTVTPLEAIREANAIGGRNGLGISHALENRLIGTKSPVCTKRRAWSSSGKASCFSIMRCSTGAVPRSSTLSQRPCLTKFTMGVGSTPPRALPCGHHGAYEAGDGDRH